LKKDLLFPSWWFSPTHLKKTCSSQIGSSSPGFGVKIKLLETTMLVSYNTKNSAFQGPFSSFPSMPFDSPPYGEGTTAQEESWRQGFLTQDPRFFFPPKNRPKRAKKNSTNS